MKDWLCRTFTPWRAAALFEDGDAWFAYLVRYDKVCNGIRVALFAVAALVPAFLISLLIAQNEKQLPKDLQQK